MSNEAVTYLVAACAGVAILAAYVGMILIPAIQSYSRAWERIAAGFLSLYVLLALMGVGAGAGAAIVWFWDRL